MKYSVRTAVQNSIYLFNYYSFHGTVEFNCGFCRFSFLAAKNKTNKCRERKCLSFEAFNVTPLSISISLGYKNIKCSLVWFPKCISEALRWYKGKT